MISILCVDDEAAFLELTRAFLELQGDILVDSAPSALEAIEMLKGHAYDAIVSDYQMPGMDGLKFLSHVRAKQGNVPFVLFTGKGREEVVIQALNLGADFYLQKGGEAKAQFAELAHKIRQAVDRRYRGEALSLAEFSVEHAAVSTLWLDDRGRILKVNREAAKLHGFEEDELLRMFIWDISPTITSDRWHTHWEELERKGQLVFETSNRKKDGTLFPAELNANFLQMNGKKYNFTYLRDISERKLAERALQESEERFRGLVEGANSLIIKYDPHGRITYVNSFAQRFFGYAEKELLGRTILETIVSESGSPSFEVANGHRFTKDPEVRPTVESLNTTKSGKYVWVAWNNKAIRDINGEVVEVLSIGNDVTERHQAEDALRESQTRLLEAQRLGKLGDLEYDPGIGKMTWSEEVFRIFGLEPEEGAMDFQKMRDHLLPADLDRWQDALESAYDGMLGVEVEYRVVRPNGELRHVAGSFKTLRYSNGQPRRFIGTMHDITERKLADEALRASEQRYRMLADLIPDLLFVVDPDGRLKYLNQRVLSLTDSRPEDLIGRHIEEAFPNNLTAQQHSEIAEVILTGKAMRTQIRSQMGTGQRWLDVALVPRLDENSKVIEVIVTSRDITDIKAMEQRLLESMNSYKAMAENLPGLVYRVHLRESNRTQFFNDMLEPLTGYQPSEIVVGEVCSIDLLIHAEDRPFVVDTIRDAINHDRPFEIEYRLLHKTGKYVQIHERGRPIRGTDGIPLYIDGVIFDISERKKGEEAIRQSEQRFRELANMLPAVVFEAELDGRLRFLNENSRSLTGYGPERLDEGLSLYDLVAEEDRARAREQIELASSGGACTGKTLAIMRQDGSSFPSTIHCAPILEDGKVVRMRGLIVDISALHEAEMIQNATLRIAQGAISRTSLPELYGMIHSILKELMPIDNFYIALMEEGRQQISFPYFVDRFDLAPSTRRAGRGLTEYVLRLGQPVHLKRGQIEELVGNHEVELVGTMPEEFIAVPLRSSDRVIGVMATQNYGAQKCLTAKDLEVLDFVSSQIALAIEKKKSETDLQRTLALLQTTFESTDDGILIVGKENRVLAYNDRFAKMWCLPEVILATKDDERIISFVLDQLKQPDVFLERVRWLYDDRDATSFDEVEFRDGRTFERYSQPYFEEDRWAGRIWSFRDITERRTAEEALNKSERELKSIINSAKDSIFVKDPEGRFVMVNEAMGQLFGVPALELAGMTDLDLFDAEVAEQNERMDQQVLAGKVVEEEVSWNIRNNLHVFSLIKVPLKSEQGDVIGICGIARDTSERKKVEKALQEANSSLNLLNSITRHDVLNQLMIIRGYSDLVRASMKDQKLLDYMDKVERATRNIRQQILFTRDFQKLGMVEAKWQSAEELIDKALTALEIGKLEISVDLGGLEVFGDPMLEKVFYNMVDNTLRHGEKATKIAVTCRREGPNLLLVYEDDGAGVKPEEKERIFDRGFGKNTGLGLFLTKAILNVTHIEIKEQGEYGKGARFEMLIPDGMYRFREWDDA